MLRFPGSRRRTQYRRLREVLMRFREGHELGDGVQVHRGKSSLTDVLIRAKILVYMSTYQPHSCSVRQRQASPKWNLSSRRNLALLFWKIYREGLMSPELWARSPDAKNRYSCYGRTRPIQACLQSFQMSEMSWGDYLHVEPLPH